MERLALKNINCSFGLLLLLFLSCQNPFATRKVEEPISVRSNREIPSVPEAVLRNLQSAIVDKNVADYMYCLTTKSTEFSFIPDDFVRQNNPTVFSHWNLDAEKNYMNQIRNYVPIDSVCRVFFYEISSEVYPDSAIMRRNYTFVINHTYQGNIPNEVVGEVTFVIFKEEGHWFIRKWIDNGSTDQPCWSTLKAGFGQ